jgi:dipeptidyl aminopeptidase/acylaminoacyl peptidase
MTSARLLCLCSALLSLPVSAQDAGVPLLPRELLFGNPERTRPQLSPSGDALAWLAPDDENVLQVWVRAKDQEDGAVVTADRKRGIRSFSWGEDSRSILYEQDADGDENFHLYQVELASKNVRDLTPWQGVRAGLLATSPRQPNVVLVELNVRARAQMDVWRLSLDTGALVLDTQNPGDVMGWGFDGQLQVRVAIASTPEGGTELRVRETPKAPWRPLISVGLEENLDFVDFTDDGRALILQSSINSDTTRLLEKSLKSGAERLLASSEKSDVMGVLGYRARHGVRAAAFDVGGRQGWTALEGSGVKADLEALKAGLAGDFVVASQDAADTKWLIAETRDVGPNRYHLYDRRTKRLELLFSSTPKLEGQPLAPMKSLTLTARDGLPLPAYLTLPVGVAPRALPLVLFVHGGPWGRDLWGYDAEAQWLANRGYAVLQVNFRASTGYGKRFLNAGNRQWGLKMHDDLLDAVAWAVSEGLADPKRVAIMGASYGGYATLAGLAFTPETFACGVDLVGPSSLFTLLATVPPYWAAFRRQLVARIGDPDKAEDKALLTRASPLFSAERIKAPLLIGQGANDPRVKVAEAEQLVAALEKKGLPVTYALYPDEGHGFARPENRIDFNARAEAFLAKCLGGRAEPLPRDGRVAGSTAVVKVVPAATRK